MDKIDHPFVRTSVGAPAPAGMDAARGEAGRAAARRGFRSRIGLFAVVAGLALSAHVAHASSVIRAYTARHSTTTRGDILLVGNTLMTCPASSACTTAQNGGNTNNNSFNMAWINADAVTTAPANSSRATLNLPAGSTVLFAGLYWGADTSAGSGGSAAPTPTARGTVRFSTPASAYTAVTASQVDLSGNRYSAFADVTARVRAAGAGSYGVSGIQAGTGSDRYAGWSLVVVIGNPALPPRNMVVFDGFSVVNASNPTSITTPVSGFQTPPSGTFSTYMGAVSYDGDRANTDSFQLNGTALSDAANPVDNVFNSSISDLGVNVTSKTPSYVNQLGFDIDRINASGILPNGSTSANLTFTVPPGGETYYPALLTFAVDVFEPVILSNLSKTVTDLNGGSVQPGDVLEYTLGVSNTGNDGATQVVLTDPIPANTTYVPSSLVIASGANAGTKTDAQGDDQANFATGPNRAVFRLGTDASATAGGTLAPNQSTTLRFRVTVNAGVADGTVIDNQGTVDYVSQTLNEPKSGPTPVASVTVANVADLSIAKTNTPGQGPDDLADDTVTSGSATTYDLVVSNSGPMAVTNALLRDPAPTGLTACTLGAPPCAVSAGTATCPTVGSGPGQLSIANLQNTGASGGVLIPSMANGSSITIKIACTVP